MTDPRDQRILDILDYARDHWKPKPGPIVLSQEYLDFLRRVEALPHNRPGADKSWVERLDENWAKDIENAVLIEPSDEGIPTAGEGAE